MMKVHPSTSDPRIATAVAELMAQVRSRYPTATLSVSQEDDPAGVYLTVAVDLDDPDDVMDLVGARLLELEVDERLPVYVVPVRTPERAARLLPDRTA